MLNINLSTVGRTIKITKVFGRTSHYCRKSDILFQIAQDSRDVLDVTFSEIDVVVKDGPSIMSSSKKGTSVIANDGIDGKERAEENHIVRRELHRRNLGVIQFGRSMILVEFVICISLAIEKCQRQMTLGARVDGHQFGRNMILLHERGDDIPDMVITCLGNHLHIWSIGNLCKYTPQTNHRIERRTARHSTLRLIIDKEDIEYGLAYTYYITHTHIHIYT